MRREITSIGIAILIVGLICAILPFFLPFEDVDTFTVSPLTTKPVIVHLKMRDRVEGYFTVRGGANDDIPFWVENPKGNRIVNPGRVYSFHSFSFSAGMDGDYYLNFDNTISIISSKTISLTVKTFLIGKLSPVIVLGVLLTVIGLTLTIAGAIMKPKHAIKEVFCRYCGTRNIEGAIYCSKCGKKIGEGT